MKLFVTHMVGLCWFGLLTVLRTLETWLANSSSLVSSQGICFTYVHAILQYAFLHLILDLIWTGTVALRALQSFLYLFCMLVFNMLVYFCFWAVSKLHIKQWIYFIDVSVTKVSCYCISLFSGFFFLSLDLPSSLYYSFLTKFSWPMICL